MWILVAIECTAVTPRWKPCLQAMMVVKEENATNELREFLLGVPLGTDQRKDIIDTIAKDIGMQKETCDFLKLLIDTNRMDAIEDIVDVFDEKYNVLTDTQVRLFLLGRNFHFLPHESASHGTLQIH